MDKYNYEIVKKFTLASIFWGIAGFIIYIKQLL